LADFEGSATEVAVTITCAEPGTAAGALYRPLDEIVPQLLPEQPPPLTFHVTLVLDVPPTVALNCCVFPVTTRTLLGEILTTIEWRIVTVDAADFEGSATEVAVTVTTAGLGTAAGAVYRPLDEIDPQVAPEQPVPLRAHVTAVLDVPVTLAANCCVFPTTTSAATGEMVTATGARTVTVADADLLGSANEVAVTLTCAGLGTAAGAV
jgi:hypothetical protein